MTNPLQIPDAAVQAAMDATSGNIPPVMLESALTAALPHLPLGYEVDQLVWSEYEQEGLIGRWDAEACGFHLFYDIQLQHDGYRVVFDHEAVGAIGLFGTLEQAKAAAQADFECRVGECHVPRPDIKTIIDEIRNGTRQGFLNEGDQPELSDAELSCPHCGGSGHIDDVTTKPVDVAAVRSPALENLVSEKWPPLKKELWRVLMDEKLNDGHYIKAFEFIEKLYSAAIRALPTAPASEAGR